MFYIYCISYCFTYKVSYIYSTEMIYFPLILPSEKEFVTAAQSRNFPLMFQPHHPVLIAINIKYLCRKFVFLMILYTCKFGGHCQEGRSRHTPKIKGTDWLQNCQMLLFSFTMIILVELVLDQLR